MSVIQEKYAVIPVKMLALLPHFVVFLFMQIALSVCVFIGIFAVLFTGKYPLSFEKVVIATQKYIFRINTYLLCLTDKYPPFPWKDDAPAAAAAAPQTPQAPQAT